MPGSRQDIQGPSDVKILSINRYNFGFGENYIEWRRRLREGLRGQKRAQDGNGMKKKAISNLPLIAFLCLLSAILPFLFEGGVNEL